MKKIINAAIIIIAIFSVVSIASASPDFHAPKIKNKDGTSSNWAGYSVDDPKGSVTDVKGSWIVPSVQDSGTTYSSFWVGIDGDISSTVEQIGTDSDVQNGVPTYYSWFEFYPHPGYYINSVPISPGDKIDVEVKSTGNNIFTLSILDETTGKSFSTSSKVGNAQKSSAEWIAEAPWSGGVLPLANFGSVTFTGCSATIGKKAGSISSFTNPKPITMVGSTGTKAVPLGLSTDGTSFDVNWVSAGP